jgi:hypothetical protein
MNNCSACALAFPNSHQLRRAVWGAASTLLLGVALPAAADISQEAQWPLASGGNGHTYRVVATSGLLSWDSANAAATTAGGYLATITSPAENAFVFSLTDTSAYWTQSINDHGPWIGLYQAAGTSEPSGGWTWVTQPGAASAEAFSFSAWESGEPNDATATVSGTTYHQDCASYFHLGTGRAPTWSDEFDLTGSSLNQWTKSYVIEFNPVPEPSVAALLGVFGLTLLGRRSSGWQHGSGKNNT